MAGCAVCIRMLQSSGFGGGCSGLGALGNIGTHWGIRVILGLYWDNGKEDGNYYSFRDFRLWVQER